MGRPGHAPVWAPHAGEAPWEGVPQPAGDRRRKTSGLAALGTTEATHNQAASLVRARPRRPPCLPPRRPEERGLPHGAAERPPRALSGAACRVRAAVRAGIGAAFRSRWPHENGEMGQPRKVSAC